MKTLILGIVLAATASAFGFNTANYAGADFTEKTVRHQNGEFCVLPNIPSVGNYSYSQKDKKSDKKLCVLDHYEKKCCLRKTLELFSCH